MYIFVVKLGIGGGFDTERVYIMLLATPLYASPQLSEKGYRPVGCLEDIDIRFF